MLLEFPRPHRCIVGTVGEPGNRTFIFQVSQGSELASVGLEKQQAKMLGRRVGEIVAQVADLGRALLPSDDHPLDMGPLDVPLHVEFRAGAIGLAWDESREAIQVELFSEELGEGDDADRNVLVQVWMPITMAALFARRVERVVESGRRSCPFCGQPVDAEGHICPRANGYRRPLL